MSKQSKYTVKARFEIGAAKSVVAADMSVADNTIYILNHGYKNGDALGQTTTATITGVTDLVTPVYVIVVDSSTIKLATSRANAFAGTAADITAAGTATFRKGALGATLSGVVIPANHYIVNARYLVHTTGASPTADGGTLAISVEGANDIVSAVSIATGTVWDDTNAQVVGIPLINTVSTYVLTTADREVTFTTATDSWTAGKLDLFLDIVPALA